MGNKYYEVVLILFPNNLHLFPNIFQNSFISYETLQNLGIPQPIQFLKVFRCYYVHSDLLHIFRISVVFVNDVPAF